MNNASLEQLNKKEIQTDIMRYRNNGTSFWLSILAIILDVAMFLIIYTNKNCKADYQLGIDLIINVIFLLAVFLIAEKTKAYNKKASIAAFVVAGIEIGRIFWIPLKYLNMWKENYAKLLESYGGVATDIPAEQIEAIVGMTRGDFTWCVVLMSCAALALIGAGVIAILRANKLQAHLAKLEEIEKRG